MGTSSYRWHKLQAKVCKSLSELSQQARGRRNNADAEAHLATPYLSYLCPEPLTHV